MIAQRKKLITITILCILTLNLWGCCIKHEWKETTCVQPKTCIKCNEIEGEALGHEWKKATCIQPQICTRCNEIEGEALGHVWKEATCVQPQICTRCNEIGGKALGHEWKEATCTNPKTCTRCNEIEGETLGHEWKKATCVQPKTCTRCKEIESKALGHTWKEATISVPKTCTRCGITDGLPLQKDEISITGERIIKRGSAVDGWEAIESQSTSNIFGFPLDDCYQTASGVYVKSGKWICKMFDSEGNGTSGQYALWSIGECGNPYLYNDGGEYDPVEGVHFWLAE